MTASFRLFLTLGVLLATRPAIAFAADDLGPRSTWATPAPAQVKAQLDGWLNEKKADDKIRGEINQLWPSEGAAVEGGVLERLAESLAKVEPRARELVDFCKRPLAFPYSLPKLDWLSEKGQSPLVANNLRLVLGGFLAQHRLYDESLEQIAALEPGDVVDPAALLFYQSAGYHRLMDKEKCLPRLARLLEREKEIPQRFAHVGRLMQADLTPLKPDTLDEISRLMDEVERRLDHGRAGKKVRDQEAEVVAKLDKMIDELEKQRQKQQQQGSGNGGGQQPSNPMQDSSLPSYNAKGDVDIKKIGDKSGWGNLPPKERQEALQQISKDLPSHYREVIEEYFRKLARDGAE